MLYIVVVFLGLALLFYLLFGGADFGAGILELFTSRKDAVSTRKVVYRAMGPVWEANHIWLILVIVILFMGFPKVFSLVTTYLHIPIVLMLIGIILRGTAFVFRHYDAEKDPRSQKLYNSLFVYSSFFTPVFLGVIAGAVILGRVNPDATDFYGAYLAPWLNWFSLALGLFTASICAYLAAVYLIGEAENEADRKRFSKQSRITLITTVLSGGLVFLAAEVEGFAMMKAFLNSPVSLVAILLASGAVLLMYRFLKAEHVLWSRLGVGAQATFILVAWMAMQYPVLLRLESGAMLDIQTAKAPDATISILAWALMIGSALILPALFYLLRSFKWKAGPVEE